MADRRAGERRPLGPTAAEMGLPEQPPCAFCDGTETELHSPFGSALSVVTYWCRACGTAFEWIKWGARDRTNS